MCQSENKNTNSHSGLKIGSLFIKCSSQQLLAAAAATTTNKSQNG